MSLGAGCYVFKRAESLVEMSKKCGSDAMAAIHETMEALHNVGAIDKQTMRRFDEACLTPIQQLTPQIKARPSSDEDLF
jgi:hypothetical protein